MQNPSKGQPFSFTNITITIEVDDFQSIFLVTLSYPNTSLKAEVWNVQLDNSYNLGMVPWFQPYQNIRPLGVGTGVAHLSAFLPGNITIPCGMDMIIMEATFETSKDTNGALDLSFVGYLAADSTKPQDIPTVRLQDVCVMATYVSAVGDAAATWDVKFSSDIVMYAGNWAPSTYTGVPTELGISIETQQGSNWSIKASALDVDFASLYQLFDSTSGGPVMDILSDINLPFFNIEYDIVGGSSHFLVQGSLVVHTLELALSYNYYSSPKHWTFQASLGSVDTTPGSDNEITIVDLIRDFDPDSEIETILDDVPFIRDVALPSVQSSPQGFDDAPIQLSVSYTGTAIVLWFQIEIITPAGELSFLFVQYKTASEPAVKAPPTPAADATTGTQAATTPTVPATAPPRIKPKRLLRVKLDKLLSLPSIPVVGTIGQPVDSINYLLVQDGGAAQTGAQTAGFTRAEMDEINNALSTSNQILYRSATSDRPQSTKTPAAAPVDKSTDYVLLEGHHIIVITDGNVVLDHLFGGQLPTGPAADPSTSNSTNATTNGTETNKAPPASNTDNSGTTKSADGTQSADSPDSSDSTIAKKDSGATMGPNKRSFGPFTLNNIGLQVKDNHLYIVLDATVMLGEISMELIGFAVGVPLSLPAPRKLSFTTLGELELSDFDIKLSGMAVDFQSANVTIAGAFQKEQTEDYEAYRGGLTVSMPPYSLIAVGAYQHTYHPTDFKSVFVFASLAGPLFTLEFAEITGVEAGFGYNYDLRLPGASDVVNFPLVHGASASDDPMTLLAAGAPGSTPPVTSFLNWTTPKEDALWFALGLKVNAFEALSVQAAVVVALGSDDTKIAIIELANASMPPSSTGGKPPGAFVYVELGIIAALDIGGGSLTCLAQLTPNSYILAPDCHLKGGFALCYWFGPSANAGDWVFTVGGYHPAFKAPDYYPQVPRLGISWLLSRVRHTLRFALKWPWVVGAIWLRLMPARFMLRLKRRLLS